MRSSSILAAILTLIIVGAPFAVLSFVDVGSFSFLQRGDAPANPAATSAEPERVRVYAIHQPLHVRLALQDTGAWPNQAAAVFTCRDGGRYVFAVPAVGSAHVEVANGRDECNEVREAMLRRVETTTTSATSWHGALSDTLRALQRRTGGLALFEHRALGASVPTIAYGPAAAHGGAAFQAEPASRSPKHRLKPSPTEPAFGVAVTDVLVYVGILGGLGLLSLVTFRFARRASIRQKQVKKEDHERAQEVAAASRWGALAAVLVLWSVPTAVADPAVRSASQQPASCKELTLVVDVSGSAADRARQVARSVVTARGGEGCATRIAAFGDSAFVEVGKVRSGAAFDRALASVPDQAHTELQAAFCATVAAARDEPGTYAFVSDFLPDSRMPRRAPCSAFEAGLPLATGADDASRAQAPNTLSTGGQVAGPDANRGLDLWELLAGVGGVFAGGALAWVYARHRERRRREALKADLANDCIDKLRRVSLSVHVDDEPVTTKYQLTDLPVAVVSESLLAPVQVEGEGVALAHFEVRGETTSEGIPAFELRLETADSAREDGSAPEGRRSAGESGSDEARGTAPSEPQNAPDRPSPLRQSRLRD
jgi:hypothetical protein